MSQKRRTLSALTDAGQDVMVLLNSPAAAQKIEKDTDLLTQRWDNLVQTLEDCSSQVRYNFTPKRERYPLNRKTLQQRIH